MGRLLRLYSYEQGADGRIYKCAHPVRHKFGVNAVAVTSVFFHFRLSRSVNIVGRINDVTLRRARLVGLLGWVTVFGG